MITINKLSLQYGSKHIFREISARINNHDRIGLAGVNGTGKSTLLKMIVGQIETDHGVIVRSGMATIGYLPQEITSIPPGRTIYMEAEAAFAETIKLQERLEQLNHELAASDPTSPKIARLIEEQGELQILLDQADIFSMQSRIEKVLHGEKFFTKDFFHTFFLAQKFILD